MGELFVPRDPEEEQKRFLGQVAGVEGSYAEVPPDVAEEADKEIQEPPEKGIVIDPRIKYWPAGKKAMVVDEEGRVIGYQG